MPRPPPAATGGAKNHQPIGRPTSASMSGGGPTDPDLIQRKIAEAKARLASNTSIPSQPRATAKGIYVPDEKGRVATPQVGLDESGGIDLQAMLSSIPKREVATAKANQRQKKDTTPSVKARFDKSKNPYLEDSAEAKSLLPMKRKARQLKFVQPGKYIEKANKERKHAQLEKLKQEIAQNVRKAGMETELDISDKTLKKEIGPPAEWWDAPFLPNKAYTDLDEAPVKPEDLDQLVTLYVHHPIPIRPPNEQNSAPVARSLMLTKKERKKLRRQRRQETQKEKQDKIRLGLLPPDPPKVKISNLMQVLGQEAIQDPTKIEARVRKEMEQRQRQHELTNEQRKLTPEERRQKIMNKLAEDKKQSNEVAVFKVKNCAHPKHRYKIEKNAQQYQLTGIVVVHEKCHLVIVEGGPKSIKAYKKLMLRRIDWNDMPTPKNENNGSTTFTMMDIDRFNTEGEENKCYLVWEGQVKTRAFRKFTWRAFESEKMAREELSKWNVEHYWDAAVAAKDEDLAARQPEL
ncbi:pre-mRNA processing factor 3-domain-containing protein [Phascolomyces articulosus]|uniref:Pre-mRNA processing factor 3-domain-containing protein n=1 Tax=Phascolomyces articulosus TaxID=60185 RepID=A0AAD5K102_9FUNG|nr:pre-mRNA processing factor 3-domain-containing protein [Phascolomyces articulosus]